MELNGNLLHILIENVRHQIKRCGTQIKEDLELFSFLQLCILVQQTMMCYVLIFHEHSWQLPV